MEVKGNIFLNKNVIVFLDGCITDDVNMSIEGYSKMIKEAYSCSDSIYYEDSEEWDAYWEKVAENDLCDVYWKGASQTVLQLLTCSFDTPVFGVLNCIDEFEEKNKPKTYGGFQYNGCPTSDYVCNKETIDKWHDEWFYNNPDRIDWSEFSHNIWPRYDRLIDIIKAELIMHNIEIPLKNSDYINCFYEQVVKHKNERDMITYIQGVVEKICSANYYHRERELERLEQQRGNSNAKIIYSIKKEGNFLFLCVDTRHGMLEYCDDRGEHIMEIRLDGTKNKSQEVDHSLKCVIDWKRKNRK